MSEMKQLFDQLTQAGQESYRSCTNGKPEKALEQYTVALNIAQESYQTEKTPEWERDLLMALNNAGKINEAFADRVHLETALELYSQALEMAESAAAIKGDIDSRQELSLVLNNTGDVYNALGGEDNKKKALVLYVRSLELRERTVSEVLNHYEYMESLLVSCFKVGTSIYADADKRKEVLSRGKDLAQTLFAMTGQEKFSKYEGIFNTNLDKLGSNSVTI